MTPSTPADDSPWHGTLLGFNAGFVDTFGFVALFGLFTTHVTGNFVLIGAAATGNGHPGLIAKLLALPTFMVGVAATRLFQLRRERRGLDTAVPLIATQLVFLVAFMLAGEWASPFAHGDAPAAVAMGLMGVLTMSIQNTAARSAFARLTPSTVMTGNVTQLVMDLVEAPARTPGSAAAAARLRKNWPTVAAFALGAMAGGLGHSIAGFWALLAPCATLVVVLWLLRRSQ